MSLLITVTAKNPLPKRRPHAYAASNSGLCRRRLGAGKVSRSRDARGMLAIVDRLRRSRLPHESAGPIHPTDRKARPVLLRD